VGVSDLHIKDNLKCICLQWHELHQCCSKDGAGALHTSALCVEQQKFLISTKNKRWNAVTCLHHFSKA